MKRSKDVVETSELRRKGLETSLRDVIRPGTKRGLDFVIIDELRKRTGFNPDAVLKFAMSEMLCNALDTDANKISVNVEVEKDPPYWCRLEVSDNGKKKLSQEDLEMILDFESKASSKRGFLMVSRGYLGNALKCVLGYSYALAESRGLNPPETVVKSGPYEYRINLKPDRIDQCIRSEVTTMERKDDGYTTFIVRIPVDYVDSPPQDRSHPSSAKNLEDIILATGMVNPDRKITYDLSKYENGREGKLESEGKPNPIRKETSVLWYSHQQFLALYEDFVRVRPETQLKEFISLFRGFTSKRVIREILQKINALNHDLRGDSVQFFPATPMKELSPEVVTALFATMKKLAKPIARNKRGIKTVLGCVGKEIFERTRERCGWQRLRYVLMPGIRMECPEWNHYNSCTHLDHVEFPYLIEVAVFDREDDGEGLKVYQCVNFMASMEDIFARIYNISFHLGRVGITQNTPMTVVVHLICPVLKWLNYGKSGLDE